MKRLALSVCAALLLSACASKPDLGPATFDEAGVQVARRGERGLPLIFIAGLSSGAWAWDPMADRYARDHVVYVLGLPGFDGLPPVGPEPLAGAERAVVALVEHQHIDRPVLIGHGFGGTIALHLAEVHPDLFRGVVSVDGLPVFPRTETLRPDQRADYAARVAATIPKDPAAYAASQEAAMNSPGGVLDPIFGKQLAARSGRSDPRSVAAYLTDYLTADFRTDLSRITVPVLVVSPYNAVDFTYQGQTLAETDKTAYYETSMKGTARLTVVSMSPARHFAMFDQPDKVAARIDAFLAALPKR